MRLKSLISLLLEETAALEVLPLGFTILFLWLFGNLAAPSTALSENVQGQGRVGEAVMGE